MVVVLCSPCQQESLQGKSSRESAYALFGRSLRKTTLLFKASLPLPSMWIAPLLYLTLLLPHGLHAANYDPYCNSNIYGKPVSIECFNSLSRFPIYDTAVRFFVEQQMRTAPPVAAWYSFKDSRPAGQMQNIVQLPKWVSFGQLSFYALPSLLFYLSNGRRHV